MLRCVLSVLRAITRLTELLALRAAPSVLSVIVRWVRALQAAIFQYVVCAMQVIVELLLREVAAAVSAIHRPPSLYLATGQVVLL